MRKRYGLSLILLAGAVVCASTAAAKDKNSDGKTFGELLEANELPAKGK